MAEYRYDAATGLGLGKRSLQEDAVIADFPTGSGCGFAVLADGMGGHAAGDIASRIVVTEIFSELKLQGFDAAMRAEMTGLLRSATENANRCIGSYAGQSDHYLGMGATVIAVAVVSDRLYWISVGDSPLYLFRDGNLRQINEDHSLAPQLDQMVRNGEMNAKDAQEHPDRHALTSALTGHPIPKVDCPDVGLQLRPGDLIILASDGMQTLPNDDIAERLSDTEGQTSAAVCAGFLNLLEAWDDPDQDNASLCLIRFQPEVIAPIAKLESTPILQSDDITLMSTQSENGVSVLYNVSRRVARSA